MRKSIALLTALVLTLSLAACVAPTSMAEGSAVPSTAPETVVFADPVLEAMVRGATGKPEGAITVAEAEAVTRLDVSFEWQQYIPEAMPIEDISGIEHFNNLESLDLSAHTITDITPLTSLTKLTLLALGGNPIADISPLDGLINLKILILTDCTAQDYSSLAGLDGLELLMLNNATISDATPLASLTSLKRLYLEGCELDYSPLADIYPHLEDRDFVIVPPPTTLAELGFTFSDGDKLALFETDEYDIRLNHGEWGDPPQPDWINCIRVVTGTESGYNNAVGFYPVHNAYVVWMFNANTQKNYTYVYDVAENSFGCERAAMEPIVREAFGDADGEDVLLIPVAFFDNTIQQALGIAIDTLYSMPFDENIVLASPYVHLGFEFLDYKGTYYYEGYGIELHIHRPEWDKDVEEGHSLDWSMSFFEPNVKGYRTEILYFADKNMYGISMKKDGAEVTFSYYPAEDRYEYDPNEIDPLRPALIEALGEDFMKVPMEIFAANVQERFGMSIEALYALSFEEGEVIPEQTTSAYAPPYKPLGFTANEDEAVCLYEQHEPHYMGIAIHRQEWGASPHEWNIEFLDSAVNGYSLLMWYFADEGKWHVHLEKDGAYCAYDDYPATDAKGWEDPSIEKVHQMVGDAFNSQGKELYYKPLEYFERVVQELFGMSVHELYALPEN